MFTRCYHAALRCVNKSKQISLQLDFPKMAHMKVDIPRSSAIVNACLKHQPKHCQRWSSISSTCFHTATSLNKDKITINIIDRKRKVHTVLANEDDSLLDVVIDNNLDLESYGVCEGTVACSTCHVVFEQEMFDKLEEPMMDETDMLDLACGLTETSRLGCQVHVSRDMDGMTVRLPEDITDARDL